MQRSGAHSWNPRALVDRLPPALTSGASPRSIGPARRHPIQPKPNPNPKYLMTRNGKIARLPAAIREELNRRLLDGEQGKQLVEWLNGLPQAQAVMQAHFQGHPISEKNLSEWKTGGFLAWEAGQRMVDTVWSVMDGTKGLETVAKEDLTHRMALMLAAKMAAEMQVLEVMPEGIEKARMWRELRVSLLALRRCELYGQRLKIEQARQTKGEKRKISRMTPAERRRTMMALLGVNEGYDGSVNPELTRPPDYGQSEPIQVNPTGLPQ